MKASKSKKVAPSKKPLIKLKFPADLEKYSCRNTSLVDLKNERWKEVPGFENYYQISNYGRVKSLRRQILYSNGKTICKKERIIRGGILPAPNYYTGDYSYQLEITFQLDNEKYHFSVGRLVYHCHVKPIDLTDQKQLVIQKDGNGLNCYYKNLSFVSTQQKQKMIYERKRSITCFSWIDMKAIAQKDLKRRMKPVTQYTDEGRRVKIFDSCKQAGEHLNIPGSHISAAANNYWPRAGGFVWRHGRGPKKIDLSAYFAERKDGYTEKRGKKVIQYSTTERRIAEFRSILEAARKTGISSSLISRAANGVIRGAHGYLWKFKN